MSIELTSVQSTAITRHGLTAEQVFKQLETFKKGIKPVELVRPATIGDGVSALPESERQAYHNAFNEAAGAGRFSMFVPASGAASRMFKALLSVYYRDQNNLTKKISDLDSADEEDRAVITFFDHIEKFAFYEKLNNFFRREGEDLIDLLTHEAYVKILKAVLLEPGLGLSELPKGLVPFHRYESEVRTAFDEHLIEAAAYCADNRQLVKVHFTVTESAQDQIKKIVKARAEILKSQSYDMKVDYSYQKASTDTVAATCDNELFEDQDGQPVFRPGGHGALLDNLNDLDADLVYIKNIDNILPDHRREVVVSHQTLLGGYLVEMQAKVFAFLTKLTQSDAASESLTEAEAFIKKHFDTVFESAQDASQRIQDVIAFLNRPMRVCGMVKNEGEPGGGPFWIKDQDGKVSKQIVEKSQVDTGDSAQSEILSRATHFNPVNLVCAIKDFRGQGFDLSGYSDPRTSFISEKSKDGKTLKALERPGLWNGAMAGWLTYFVEVPVETFAPVKELNDLLRTEHQSE